MKIFTPIDKKFFVGIGSELHLTKDEGLLIALITALKLTSLQRGCRGCRAVGTELVPEPLVPQGNVGAGSAAVGAL